MNRKKLIIISLLLSTFFAFSQSKFIGTFKQRNDTIFIFPDSTFKLSIQGLDAFFHLRHDVYTGKAKINGEQLTIIKFDQPEQNILFWKCKEIWLKGNKIIAPNCNTTSSKESYKRIKNK